MWCSGVADANTNGNGNGNGDRNGHCNGDRNGHCNGHGYSHANTNGHGYSHANSDCHGDPASADAKAAAAQVTSYLNTLARTPAQPNQVLGGLVSYWSSPKQSAAPPSAPLSNAWISAASSSSDPRATLISLAPRFIFAICGAPIRCLVSAVSGAAINT